ncbi:FAD-linked oxidase C-terminal domain-containing protein [Paraburkholderia heleia]|uniref:FAD-linked oxidase C-terminal domain-containing protein n=1 Tax=Paraburkholderia heleia TaxID=634127 RepID=UPI003CD05DEE
MPGFSWPESGSGSTRRLVGTISAKHCIGLTKKLALPCTRSEAGIELMRRIKRALGPDGLLPPAKVLRGALRCGTATNPARRPFA